MKIVAMLLVLGILVSCSGNSETLKFDIDGDQEITILNLFDVTTEDEALNYGDGFSSVIQVDDVTVLFDTPYKDYVMDNGDSRMMQNIAILEYQVEAVDIVYISHRHSKPGLVPFLEMNSDVELYLTSDIDMTRTNERFALDYYHDEPFKEIGNHIYTSGPMLGEKDGKEVIEQFMLIETESGIIIVVG
ncbi:hypothetical protein, partial [Sphaerochaeta sp. S2]|uniref:hypothetical protein n=1 Tax=Sphaerochaeta sp. S2 TaxID=2798868 RepID=UPI0018E90B64